jgi:hypothetical protein
MGMEKYTPNRARFSAHVKYTTFRTERFVALRSVNNTFPESYDFAAKVNDVLNHLNVITVQKQHMQSLV